MFVDIDFRNDVPSHTPALSRLAKLAAWAGAVSKALNVPINVRGTTNALKVATATEDFSISVTIDINDPSEMAEGLERFMNALASVTGAKVKEWEESGGDVISRFIKVGDVVVQINYDSDSGNIIDVVLTA